jgi:hypothetical protein
MAEAIPGDPNIDVEMSNKSRKLMRLSSDLTMALREHSTLKNLSKDVLQEIKRASAEIQANAIICKDRVEEAIIWRLQQDANHKKGD